MPKKKIPGNTMSAYWNKTIRYNTQTPDDNDFFLSFLKREFIQRWKK